MEFTFIEFKTILVFLLGCSVKTLTHRNMTLGPFELVELGEVLNQVAICTPCLGDLSEIDDSGTGELEPFGFDDCMREKAALNEEVVMGPSCSSNFCNSEVLNASKFLSQSAYKNGDASASRIKSFSFGGIQGRVNCKCEESRRRGFLDNDREAFNLNLGTGTAGPPFAREREN
jgi:hypothetical protein